MSQMAISTVIKALIKLIVQTLKVVKLCAPLPGSQQNCENRSKVGTKKFAGVRFLIHNFYVV